MLKEHGIALRNSEEGWTWPNIDHEVYQDLAYKAKYGELFKEEAMLLASAVSALNHIANPIYTMKSIVNQFKQIRNFRKGE